MLNGCGLIRTQPNPAIIVRGDPGFVTRAESLCTASRPNAQNGFQVGRRVYFR